MPQRRSKMDIRFDILDSALNGAVQTRIIYKSNLNFNVMKTYFEELIDNGLLEKNGKYYTTTDRGRAFMAIYTKLRSMIK